MVHTYWLYLVECIYEDIPCESYWIHYYFKVTFTLLGVHKTALCSNLTISFMLTELSKLKLEEIYHRECREMTFIVFV